MRGTLRRRALYVHASRTHTDTSRLPRSPAVWH